MKPQFTSLDNKNTEISDELVKRCKKGDQKAQLQVYKLYYKPVFSTCKQIVNDPSRAEDLMHESFILAFENINSYIGDISFSSWVKKFIKAEVQ
jgi:DNA-directed RNA polymerase specialized sigma24 family protein